LGEDLQGNVYYVEETGDPVNPDKRTVELKDPDSDVSKLPVQWQSWLNRRRAEAPTLDELRKHEQSLLTLKQRVAELKEEEEKAQLQELAAIKAREAQQQQEQQQQQQQQRWTPRSSSSSSTSSSQSSQNTTESSSTSDGPSYSAWRPKK